MTERCRRVFVTLLILPPVLGACRGLAPARRTLTYEDVYGPRRLDLNGPPAPRRQWLKSGARYLEWRDDGAVVVDAATGREEPAWDADALAAALRAQGDFDERAVRDRPRRPMLLSDDLGVALLEHDGRLYAYRFADGTLRRLTRDAAERSLLTLSPDGGTAVFRRDHELWALDTATGVLTRLTFDGTERVLNGELDWVYQEEIFGRGTWGAYWWSPDSAQVAFLQLDTTEVPVYPLVDELPRHPKVRALRYPKAGDPNARVRLGVVPVYGGPVVWADLSAYAGEDILIVHVAWAPDGRVAFQVQDREQRWLELNLADPATGAVTRLLREETPAWTTVYGPPRWLADGCFLWRAAPDGWPHVYRHAADGRRLGAVTRGAWEVRELHAVDEAGGWVYVSGTADSPVEEHVYRVPLAGGAPQRLTTAGYYHEASFSADGTYFFDCSSNLTTPPRVELRAADGTPVRVLREAPPDPLAGVAHRAPQLVRVPTPRGYGLNALLLLPPRVPAGKRCPVVVLVYGGPHLPSVANRWEGHGYLFKQLLAAQGWIVWEVDPYSASGEGEVSAWTCYRRLGVTETRDLEDSLRWLAEHAPADLGRVAIHGHSYGGYLTAYALTHSRLFKVGLAAAALTDWRNYDSVYAERYLQTPERNPEGYRVSSVVEAAADLHGRLLLVHGTEDDNVHFQNLEQLVRALQAAGKMFDLMVYPGNDHGLWDNFGHWDRLRVEYLKQHL